MLLLPGGTAAGVLWISAGEETVVYLGGVPHALRSISSPNTPAVGGGGASAEEALRADVVTEVMINGGRILTFSPAGVAGWLPVATGGAQTTSEVITGPPGCVAPSLCTTKNMIANRSRVVCFLQCACPGGLPVTPHDALEFVAFSRVPDGARVSQVPACHIPVSPRCVGGRYSRADDECAPRHSLFT